MNGNHRCVLRMMMMMMLMVLSEGVVCEWGDNCFSSAADSSFTHKKAQPVLLATEKMIRDQKMGKSRVCL